MSDDTLYQQLRSHLHYLKLAAVADALAPALEHADRERPDYTEFLHALLKTEVTRPNNAACKAACASQSCPPARPWRSSTTTPSPPWTGA